MSLGSYETSIAGERRAVRAASRPALRSPMAHPKRGFAAGGVARPKSCVGVARQAEPVMRWMGLRVAAIGLLAVAGAGTAVYGFMQPEPKLETPSVSAEAAAAWGQP